ncbi:MAG: polyketide synthase dehydratase domain-containing protein, partial [Cyanobacteria bacterium J06648_11]
MEILDTEEFYQRFVEKGIDYGSDFRAVEAIWHGDRAALAKLKLPESLREERDRYILHPVLIDAGFQAVGAALRTDVSSLYLPVAVERLRVFAPIGAEAWSYAQLRQDEGEFGDTIAADVTVFDEAEVAIACIEGLTLKRASREQLLGVKSEDLNDWFYKVEWQLKGRLGGEAPDFIPALADISDRMRQQWTATLVKPDMLKYLAAFPQLEALCAAYIPPAFEQMGWPLEVGQRFSEKEAIARTGTVAQHHALLRRLLDILAEDGMLQREALGWLVSRSPESINLTELAQQLAERFPEIDAELVLTSRCGQNLAAVLQGKCDPLQDLLAPDGDLSALTRLYRDSPGAVAVNRLL